MPEAFSGARLNGETRLGLELASSALSNGAAPVLLHFYVDATERTHFFGPVMPRSSIRFTCVGFPRVITGYEVVVVNIIRPALLIVARSA